MTFGQELLFRRFGMDKNDIRISAPCSVERSTGANRNHFYGDPGLFLEKGQNVAE